MINLNLEDFNLSSSLSNKFTIGQVRDWAECSVYINGYRIFHTTLYAKDDTVTFYDLRSLVEDYMRSQWLTRGEFRFVAAQEGGMEQLDGIFIIFAPFKHGMDSDLEFLESHFLTSRRNYSVPRGYLFYLNFFATNHEQFIVNVECFFRKNGELNPCSYQEPVRPEQFHSVYTFRMDSDFVTRRCYEVDGDEMGELMTATVTVGNRCITIYYTNEKPIVSFGFRNIFNVREYAHIVGKETLKTDISRKEAVCQGVTSFYDETIERKHHIETCHLTPDEASWLNELLYSQYIFVRMEPEQYQIEVVISDITSDIHYSPSEQTRIKFAWRYADGNEWRSIVQPVQIFNDNFNPTFQ